MSHWSKAATIGVVMSITNACAAEYFVDASNGRDSNSGLSPAEAWQSVRQVNSTALKPGDVVRFKAGEIWRESLQAKSGAPGQPITFTSYGEGPKPALYASVDLAAPDIWTDLGNNIWATKADSWDNYRPHATFAPGDWNIFCDGDARATLAASKHGEPPKVFTIDCIKPGKVATNIQLNYFGIPLAPDQNIRFRFRARASKPFSIKNIALMRSHTPWGDYGKVIARSTDISTEWQEHEVLMTTTIPDNKADGRLSFFIGDAIPEGCSFEFVPLGAELFDLHGLDLKQDVGNIVLTPIGETNQIAAWKRWNTESLKKQGDFYHDLSDSRVYFYSEKEPTTLYSAMEAARRRNIVALGKNKHFIVDGFTIAYTGAHGANGAPEDCVIRNCDFRWIGGSLLYTRNGRPTRYGNGVEFWSSCKNIVVEHNTFEDVYDTAMTNQGPDAGRIVNVVWQNNKTVRCEQAYEIWLSHEEMTVESIIVRNSTFIDSGFGWSHEQRPDIRGCHLLSYGMKCKIVDLRYENNVMINAKDAILWFSNDRVAEFKINNNRYIQPGENPAEAKLFRWPGIDKGGITFAEYQRITGLDSDSTLSNK